NNVPVLIVAIKPPGNIRLPSAREDADTQTRRRLQDLSEDCLLPTLHAVSAFGTQLAFYRMAKGHQIVPDRIPPDPTLLTDTAPLLWWSCDVLQDEGRRRFSSMVTEIEQACKSLERQYFVDKQSTLADALQNQSSRGCWVISVAGTRQLQL
ncbi:hypothetical protein B0H12DRAFT_1016675, partial [Mycena haematopus]